MADRVRWGILGASAFALKHMAPAIHRSDEGVLASLATSTSAKAEGFRRLAPDLRVHESYEALLADPDIDAIYIPLPNHLHVEWTHKAAEAGKHVLCEKPIALRADEIDELIALRDRTGKLISEAYMIVHHPQWQKAQALFREGVLGDVPRISAAFSFNNPDPENIRNRQGTGGGALRDIGVYIFGSTRFVTGEEPQEILWSKIDRDGEVDLTTHLHARFASFDYSGMVSMRLAPYQEMVFHGREAVMKLTAPFNAGTYGEARVDLLHSDQTRRTWRFPAVDQYLLQVNAFNASVLRGEDWACPLEFSRGTQAMMDMVFASAE